MLLLHYDAFLASDRCMQVQDFQSVSYHWNIDAVVSIHIVIALRRLASFFCSQSVRLKCLCNMCVWCCYLVGWRGNWQHCEMLIRFHFRRMTLRSQRVVMLKEDGIILMAPPCVFLIISMWWATGPQPGSNKVCFQCIPRYLQSKSQTAVHPPVNHLSFSYLLQPFL